MKKVILMVLDSMGVGELPDAKEYGDLGADTLGHIIQSKKNLDIPNLKNLGIGNIDGVAWRDLAVANPKGA